MIAQTIGATLALWPRLGRVGLRPAPPSGALTPDRCEMRGQQPHRWAFEREWQKEGANTTSQHAQMWKCTGPS